MEHVPTPIRPALGGGARSSGEPRAPAAGERAALLDWLDDGLRGGRRGRLAAEYPISLAPERRADHRVVRAGGVPLAHAMLHEVVVRSPAARLRTGLIGLVYTAPPARRRGLARSCIASCLDELARRGVPLALLWSDRHDFYRRQGFEPAGCEEQLRLDAARCRHARGSGAEPLRIGPARPGDFRTLETLHDAKPVGALRRSGDLARLARAPDLELVVARRAGGEALAYAALGRGDDFGGVVHEWAGERDAVLACWQHLCEVRGSVDVLSGPVREPPVARVVEQGAPVAAGCLALARILDPAALWRTLVGPGSGIALDGTPEEPLLSTPRGTLRLAHGEALALLFGPRAPLRVGAALAPADRAALAACLPFPLYVWGFDSV